MQRFNTSKYIPNPHQACIKHAASTQQACSKHSTSTQQAHSKHAASTQQALKKHFVQSHTPLFNLIKTRTSAYKQEQPCATTTTIYNNHIHPYNPE